MNLRTFSNPLHSLFQRMCHGITAMNDSTTTASNHHDDHHQPAAAPTLVTQEQAPVQHGSSTRLEQPVPQANIAMTPKNQPTMTDDGPFYDAVAAPEELPFVPVNSMRRYSPAPAPKSDQLTQDLHLGEGHRPTGSRYSILAMDRDQDDDEETEPFKPLPEFSSNDRKPPPKPARRSPRLKQESPPAMSIPEDFEMFDRIPLFASYPLSSPVPPTEARGTKREASDPAPYFRSPVTRKSPSPPKFGGTQAIAAVLPRGEPGMYRKSSPKPRQTLKHIKSTRLQQGATTGTRLAPNWASSKSPNDKTTESYRPACKPFSTNTRSPTMPFGNRRVHTMDRRSPKFQRHRSRTPIGRSERPYSEFSFPLQRRPSLPLPPQAPDEQEHLPRVVRQLPGHDALVKTYSGRSADEYGEAIFSSFSVGSETSASADASTRRQELSLVGELRRSVSGALTREQFDRSMSLEDIAAIASRVDRFLDSTRYVAPAIERIDVYDDVDWQAHQHKVEVLKELRLSLYRLERIGLPTYPRYLQRHPSVQEQATQVPSRTVVAYPTQHPPARRQLFHTGQAERS